MRWMGTQPTILLLFLLFGSSAVWAGSYVHDPKPDIALGCGFFDDIPNPVSSYGWMWNLTRNYSQIKNATLTFRIYDDGENQSDRVQFLASDWLWGSQTKLGIYELPPFTSESLSYDVTGVLQTRLFIRVTVMCLGGPDFYFDRAELEVEGTPLGDTDGVSDEVEDMVPSATGHGSGDGNGDGKPDGGQNHVASLPNHASAPDQTYITAICEEAYPLVDVQALPTVSPPEGWDFPYGALSLKVDEFEPGGTVTLTVMIPTDTRVDGVLKRDTEGTWQVISRTATHGPPEAPTKTVLSFQLVDGGPFDEDGGIDGSLSDDMFIGIEVREISCIVSLMVLPLLCALSRGRMGGGKQSEL